MQTLLHLITKSGPRDSKSGPKVALVIFKKLFMLHGKLCMVKSGGNICPQLTNSRVSPTKILTLVIILKNSRFELTNNVVIKFNQICKTKVTKFAI